jgi:hypothetical protein
MERTISAMRSTCHYSRAVTIWSFDFQLGQSAREIVSVLFPYDLRRLVIVFSLTILSAYSAGDSLSACSWADDRVVSLMKRDV